ncbi:MAG: hypothetical protein O7C75_09535 [Verrucomicrobia bacterium]|nr:hypothetical protein [Verrucomicrobiota bacterium]
MCVEALYTRRRPQIFARAHGPGANRDAGGVGEPVHLVEVSDHGSRVNYRHVAQHLTQRSSRGDEGFAVGSVSGIDEGNELATPIQQWVNRRIRD